MNNSMRWGFHMDLFTNYNLTIAIKHDISSHNHCLITGSSGSGKSYALLYLLGMLLKSEPTIKVYFCDFKNSNDFNFLKDYEHYYSGNKCYKGIMDYYKAFTEARVSGNSDTRHILICDEYPAFINYLQMKDKQDKTKYATDILSAVSEILMLGRGIGFGIWIITQRADNSLFNNGARDNFMIIVALGRLSREQKSMLFSGEELPDKIYRQGEGILLADGYELKEVKYPKINNVSDWKRHILSVIKQ
ncbi:FtsK/SpoIIIE domain-containing protein [Clostridium manihotivorum]|nr:FtsK/SpoIIIE domain-containing protein [Clostridium manihotivorum]